MPGLWLQEARRRKAHGADGSQRPEHMGLLAGGLQLPGSQAGWDDPMSARQGHDARSASGLSPSPIPAPVQRAIDQWIADDVADRLLGISRYEHTPWGVSALIDDNTHRTTYLGISRDQHSR